MSRWRECRLGDVLTLQRGFDITKAAQVEGSVPVVSSSGINSFHDTAMVEAPGVVIGRKGSLGTCFFLDQAFWPHDTTLWIKDFKGNDPRFCYYLLRGMDLSKHDVGAANPTLNRNHVHLLRVSKPDVNTQRRITSILGAYDDLIEVNQQRIAVLEKMAQGLFEEWFVRFRFPGHKAVPILDTPIGRLPEGWRHAVLGDLVEQRRDATSAGEHLNGRAYVPIECIARRSLTLDDVRPWEEAQSSLQLFSKGDILFGAMRAYFHKVAPAPLDGVTRSTCFVLRPRSPFLKAYSLQALFREETIAYASVHSKGSTIPYAQWTGILERMPCLFPDEQTLQRFQLLVQPMVDLIVSLWFQVRNLATSRDLLLPRLISGQLSVTGAERQLEEAA
ncbi:restriction endonuclease subunit S [Rhizobium ruizarguesonis]|uniref:restriction endonuclease subunit S n=1 Tax=Rhizobium ruizarguesonis TaxID=2081791 RepID=UPI001030F5B1|nr:restriction endonuclease subunit S [Rhizobium ruizarguesonis]TAU47468.1 restriction endonuclease subunit S [Rhizobium ruizarguesonis]TAU62538.1 restriction endonuclease subunit S [Rhizobium ruizarguesonis]